MTNFKATNSFKLTKFAFYERLRFKLNAYKDLNHSNLKDINFSSLALYGRINAAYDTIYPDEIALKQISNSKYQLQGFRRW